jgi:RND family efflux transporter MFP subunit
VRRLALFIMLAACKSPDAEEKEAASGPVKVTCAAVAGATMGELVTLRGVVAAPPNRQATVAAAIPGRILELRVQEGEVVDKGAVVATVEDPALAAAEAEADAQVATARAAEAAAGAAAARAHRLLDEGIAPRRDVEDADAKAAQAAAEHRAALAKRALAAAQRARAQVKTPIAGTIVRVLRRAGELVDGTAQTPIVEVADPARLELRSDAAGSDLVRVFPGLLASVRLDAVPDERLAGRVVAVSPGVDPATGLGWVRVLLELPGDSPIRPRLGLAGEAEILAGGRSGLVAVPASAVRRGSEGHPEVLVCTKKGQDLVARVEEVQIAGHRGETILLSQGVGAGDRVIVDHVLNVEDGAAIALEDAK